MYGHIGNMKKNKKNSAKKSGHDIFNELGYVDTETGQAYCFETGAPLTWADVDANLRKHGSSLDEFCRSMQRS